MAPAAREDVHSRRLRMPKAPWATRSQIAQVTSRGRKPHLVVRARYGHTWAYARRARSLIGKWASYSARSVFMWSEATKRR